MTGINHILEEDIKRVLARNNYVLLPEPEEQTDSLPRIEDVILSILSNSPQARFIRGIPIILYKNLENIDFQYLADQAIRLNHQNRIGYLTEITLVLVREIFTDLDRSNLEQLIKKMDESKITEEHTISSENPLQQEYNRRHNNPLAQKWNIVYNMPISSFRKHFRYAIQDASKLT